ncbi:MAG: glycosyltransferase family 2 protein [Chitinophagaceae bacterium]
MLKKKYPKMNDREYDFAAIVTAHQDIRFIPPLVDSFCKQSYTNLIVYVIADDCNIVDLHFNDPRIKIFKPLQALNAKIQSIKFAVDHFIRPHDILVVFDSDNLVHPDYFVNLNQYFQRGFRAVQTHMLSKNSDTIFAKLDSIGHIYNTFVEREAKMELGLSSSILGLGIAIETDLYKQVIYKEVLGGFDKKLQADIILSVPQLAFAGNAIVYDEKVDDGITLEKQRTRWIYTYFEYFHVNWNIFLIGWKKLNFNLIFFGFSALKPPLFIIISLSVLCMGIGFFIDPLLTIIWAMVLLLFFITFVVIVLTQGRQKGMFKAILYVPLIIVRQISALLKIRKAGKDFLKTEHIKIIYIDELLKNETL